MIHPEILTFEAALAAAKGSPTCAAKKRLLLGNGFSMACYGQFGYQTLYERVREIGIPENVQRIFEKYGETNFEAVMKMLDAASEIAQIYELYEDDSDSEMKKDYEALKEALVRAISEVHPEHRGMISNAKYQSCYSFITQFDDIYTVNYDLLLYWTSLQHEPFPFGDFFSKDEDTDGNNCEFMPQNDTGRSSIFFLHGGLHIYSDDHGIRKRVWKDTDMPLVSQVRTALDNKEYPLIVSEGHSEAKLAQIQVNRYLGHCMRKFHRIQGHLFTFGHSLSEQDAHIADVIAKNEELRHLWIGIRGDFNKPSNIRILETAEQMKQKRREHIEARTLRGKKKGDLSVHFYDADSAKVWG